MLVNTRFLVTNIFLVCLHNLRIFYHLFCQCSLNISHSTTAAFSYQESTWSLIVLIWMPFLSCKNKSFLRLCILYGSFICKNVTFNAVFLSVQSIYTPHPHHLQCLLVITDNMHTSHETFTCYIICTRD